jgi:hypothetical protein
MDVGFMFKDRLLNALKEKKSANSNDEKFDRVMNKIQRQKRLSSHEFQSVFDSLWKEGPAVQYLNPDGRVRDVQSLSNHQNL